MRTFKTSNILTRILFTLKGILEGSLTMGILALVVFVALHFAHVPAGGKTTWIILGIIALLAVARGIYVTKSELHRLENYRL